MNLKKIQYFLLSIILLTFYTFLFPNVKINAIMQTTIIDDSNYDQYFTAGGDALNISNSPLINGVKSVQLTTAEPQKAGSSSLNQYIDLTQDFIMDADIYLGNMNGNGADGITFTLHKGSVGQVGINGSNLGAGGLPGGVAIEFDTYTNPDKGDYDNHHIAIDDTDTSNGNIPGIWTAIQNSPSDITGPISIPGNGLDDDLWHHVLYSWDSSSQILSCDFTKSQGEVYHLQKTSPFGTINDDNKFYTFCFSAGTGQFFDQQAIHVNSLTASITPIIGGYVFLDQNANGKLDEMSYNTSSSSFDLNSWNINQPIANATIHLLDSNNNPLTASDGVTPVTTTTDSNGYYSFRFDTTLNPNFSLGSTYFISVDQSSDLPTPYQDSNSYSLENGFGFDGSGSTSYNTSSNYSVISSGDTPLSGKISVDLSDNNLPAVADNFNIGLSYITPDPISYNITATVDTSTTNGANGSVTITNTTNTSYMENDTINLTPPSIPDYTFDSWNIIEPTSLSMTGNTFIMPSSDVTLQAKYVSSGAQIQVTKVDSEDNSILLSGANFDILDPDGNVVDSLITGDDGTAFSTDGVYLIPGEYMLTETKAPDGYLLSDGQTFTITGEETSPLEIVFSNDKFLGQVLLTKVDSSTDETLPGATFNVVNSLGETVDTLTTGDDGTALTSEGVNLSPDTYELIETVPPLGYKLTLAKSFTVVGDETMPIEITISNDKLVMLPATGSIFGFIQVLILGILLLSSGVIINFKKNIFFHK